MTHLAGARIQHSRAIGETGRECVHGLFNGNFEMQQVASQKTRQALFDRLISQAFLRASIMMVDPAPHAAPSIVGGSARRTSAKYKPSLRKRFRAPSRICRMRRAMGSRPGASVVAKPAGLSRSEKCLRRTTS